MRVGHVLRLAIRFREGIWRRLLPKMLQAARRDGFGFIHSQGRGIPVWWSLSDQPILVAGWAGGPAAKALLRLSGAARRRRAILSLAGVLGVSPQKLRRSVLDWQGHVWTRDPFSRGGYSFIGAGGDGAGKELGNPVRDTIFFAGEATWPTARRGRNGSRCIEKRYSRSERGRTGVKTTPSLREGGTMARVDAFQGRAGPPYPQPNGNSESIFKAGRSPAQAQSYRP